MFEDSDGLGGFTAFGEWLYFRADDGASGAELWRTNGITTAQVANINPGAANSYPNNFVALGDWLYFRADDGTSGSELWRTNGTSTTRVADINTTGNAGSFPNGLTVLGSYIYFNANDPANDKLYYDKDGAGGSAAVVVASITLAGSSAPAWSDFLLVT